MIACRSRAAGARSSDLAGPLSPCQVDRRKVEMDKQLIQLRDPRSGKVFAVGCTRLPVKSWAMHLKVPSREHHPTVAHFRSILDAGLEPIVEIVAKDLNGSAAIERKTLVEKLIAQGHSDLQRERRPHPGHSEATRQLMSVIQRASWSPERRQR
jgi:hypothetical protein